MPDAPVIGQEAVVPTHGFGRITEVTMNYISVKTYIDGVKRRYVPDNVRLIKLNYVGK